MGFGLWNCLSGKLLLLNPRKWIWLESRLVLLNLFLILMLVSHYLCERIFDITECCSLLLTLDRLWLLLLLLFLLLHHAKWILAWNGCCFRLELSCNKLLVGLGLFDCCGEPEEVVIRWISLPRCYYSLSLIIVIEEPKDVI